MNNLPSPSSHFFTSKYFINDSARDYMLTDYYNRMQLLVFRPDFPSIEPVVNLPVNFCPFHKALLLFCDDINELYTHSYGNSTKFDIQDSDFLENEGRVNIFARLGYTMKNPKAHYFNLQHLNATEVGTLIQMIVAIRVIKQS